MRGRYKNTGTAEHQHRGANTVSRKKDSSSEISDCDQIDSGIYHNEGTHRPRPLQKELLHTKRNRREPPLYSTRPELLFDTLTWYGGCGRRSGGLRGGGHGPLPACRFVLVVQVVGLSCRRLLGAPPCGGQKTNGEKRKKFDAAFEAVRDYFTHLASVVRRRCFVVWRGSGEDSSKPHNGARQSFLCLGEQTCGSSNARTNERADRGVTA